MAQMGIRSFPSNDGRTVTIEMIMDGQALGHIILPPDQLDRFIAALAANRASCTPGVAEEFNPATLSNAVVDPSWITSAVNLDPSASSTSPEGATQETVPAPEGSGSQEQAGQPLPEAGVMLAVRHPGLSWVTFILPSHEATAMGRGLIEAQQAADGLTGPRH